jgi:hypothetical protein
MGWPVNNYIPGGFDVTGSLLTGTVYHDIDSSLTQNGSEAGLYSQKVILLPDSNITFSQANGEYTLGSNSGNKTIKVVPGPLWKTTSDSTININVVSGNYPGNNFGLKGLIDIYLIDVSITSSVVPRCFWSRPYVITYTNTGTLVTHGEIKYVMPAACTWDSSSVPYTSVLGNTYTWAYTNLQPGETRNITVWVTLPGAGTVITSTAQGNAQNPLNAIVYQDEAFMTQTVSCSFDPNDKTVIPEGVMTPHYTLMTDSLDFVIRFQNTGTDTAFKVVIIDTLNKNILDISSFQLITYSHPVVVDLKTNGKLTLTFDNILLPDSNINEPGSHGYIRFRCMAKSGLMNNSVLMNKAYIYFDLNAPVVTNFTFNTLVYTIPTGISETGNSNAVTVMPNPVTAEAVFILPDAGEVLDLKIYDSAGRLLFDKPVSGRQAVIPARMLHSGILYYQVRSKSGKIEQTGKFVVL